MLLPHLLDDSADRYPDRTAVVFPEQTVPYGTLHRQSSQVAARLRRLGIGPGVRVAILHENALAAIIYFWGVLKSGAQVVDVPCLASVDTVSAILAESRPKVLVVSDRQLQRLSSAKADSLPSIVFTTSVPAEIPGCEYHSLTEITSTESADVPSPALREWDVALIVYTSGTTGEPKGVMLSHRNLLSNIRAANHLTRLTSEDSILLAVPLHFIHGRMQLLTHALIGGSIAFSAGFQFPQKVVEELSRYCVTGFSGVPFHFSILLERTSLATTQLPHLRYVVVTGGALPSEALYKLSEALRGVALHIAYGLTEASPRITCLMPSEVFSRSGSCGLPLPGVRVDILTEDGLNVPPGIIGEIVVSGPNVMCGYFSSDETTTERIDSFGRLHTGDLGQLDEDGYLYVVGRKSELIKTAGERVFPREIETVLNAHPEISESAVFGIPDRLLGEKIVACVVPQPGASIQPERIRTHCLKFLPLVRVPREIYLSPGLPKTTSGKNDRRALAAHLSKIILANANVA